MHPDVDSGGTTTVRAVLNLSDAEAGELVALEQPDGCEALALLLRVVGEDPSFSEWDRRQNYAPFLGTNKMVLECAVVTEPPLALIATSRKNHIPVAPAVEKGLLRLGVPLAMLDLTAPIEVLVRLGGPIIELVVDGVVADVEWPAGPWRSGKIARTSTAVVAAELCAGLAGDPTEPPQPPIGPYWVPAGHNTWFGDTMLMAEGDRLHLVWLTDRRHGASKFGCGACSYAHASTTDLVHWEHHPLVFPLTKYEEESIGTGCVMTHDGVHHVLATVIMGKLNLGRDYREVRLATSRDGIHFASDGLIHGLPNEPGIIRDDEGVFHAVSSSCHADGKYRTGRYESSDLRHWELKDPDFLPAPGWPPTRAVFSNECFNWFALGEWFYIIGGRTGFWRSRQVRGPYQPVGDGGPKWDIYDGLMVPQVAVWKGRAIMAGWLPPNELDWGGHLVFRELRQRADGELQLQRLTELENDLSAECRRRWRVTPLHPRQRFGVRWADCVDLVFDPEQKSAQWGEPGPEGMPFKGGDFSILNVEGLDQPFELEMIIYPDAKSSGVILDAMINQQRTMITWRPRTEAMDLSQLLADGCEIQLIE